MPEIHSETVFESTFERGGTFIAEPADSGQETLLLLENENLADWPLDSGWGMLNAEDTVLREHFTYVSRAGNRLSGVRGIRKRHPQYTSASFGGFEEGWKVRTPMQVEDNTPLIGQFSIASDSTRPDPYNFERFIPPLRELYVRFYIRFGKFVLVGEKPDTVRTGFYFLSLTQNTPSQENVLFMFWLLDPFRAEQRLVLTMRSVSGGEDSLVYPVKIDPAKSYCIEAHVKTGDPKQGGAEWWIDGRHAGARFSVNNGHADGVNACIFRCRSITGVTLKKYLVYDQIAVATHYLGTVPPRPEPSGFNEQGLFTFRSPGSVSPDAALQAVHVQIDTAGNWMWPVYNSGETAGGITAVNLSGEVSPGREYLLRARYKNSLGNWGGYCPAVRFSVPAAFSGKAGKPAPFSVSEIRISAEPGGSPAGEIQRETWYYLSAGLEGIKIPDGVFFMQIWMHTPFYPLGNIGNKGGGFSETGNYIISFSASNRTLVTRSAESYLEPFSNTGVRGPYVDDADSLFVKSLDKGRLVCRFRLPEKASAGPWSVKAFCRGLNGDDSPLYTGRFMVKAAVQETPVKKRSLLPWAILAAVLLIIAVIGKHPMVRKSGQDARVVSREEELVGKAVKFVQENFHEDISSSDIAGHVGLSDNHFRAIFKKVKKETLFNYVIQCRIEASKKLMKTTNLNITEILFKVGYKDSSTFSRIFKKNEGVSPLEYMRKVRNGL